MDTYKGLHAMVQDVAAGSILPLELVDDQGVVVDTLVCDTIAGGQCEVEGMPKDLILCRETGGRKKRARYVHAGEIRD